MNFMSPIYILDRWCEVVEAKRFRVNVSPLLGLLKFPALLAYTQNVNVTLSGQGCQIMSKGIILSIKIYRPLKPIAYFFGSCGTMVS